MTVPSISGLVYPEYSTTNALREERMFNDDILNSETLPYLLHFASCQYRHHLTTKEKHLGKERQYLEKKEGETIEQIELIDRETVQIGFVNKVSRSLASFGLLGSGVAAVAAGQSGGIPTIVAGILLSIDTLCDDPIKKQIASWLQTANGEDRQTWESRIALFFTITPYVLSFGLQQIQAVQIAIKVTDAAVGALEGGLAYKQDLNHALLIELDAECKESAKHIEQLIHEMHRLIETITHFYESFSQIEKNRKETISFILTRRV